LDTLGERHGVVEKTTQHWFDRFEEESIEQAPYDAPQPGGDQNRGKTVNNYSKNCNSRGPNSATTSKHGTQSYRFITSKKSMG
jgi:hypothetical protein